MRNLLYDLTPADYHFLAGVIDSPLNLTDDARLHRLAERLEESPEDESVRGEAAEAFEREIRYLGSSEIAYAVRYAAGMDPGVSFAEIIRDVARRLKVRLERLGTEREMVQELVTTYATNEFSRLSPDDQQKMLTDLGVEQEKAARFIKKSAGVFALPVMIQAFNAIVIEGLIKRVVFGAIARIIGAGLSRKLFLFIAGRFPWWVSWIGPVAWAGSIGWTALDLQGPASRKTIPVVLYLGLCVLRQNSGAAESAGDEA